MEFKKYEKVNFYNKNKLLDIEKKFIDKQIKNTNYEILKIKIINDIKYVVLYIKDLSSENPKDYFKIIKLPKLNKVYIKAFHYSFRYVYVFENKEKEVIIKKNKCQILDKSNHFRPIEVGYINSKGFELKSIDTEYVPCGTYDKLICVGLD